MKKIQKYSIKQLLSLSLPFLYWEIVLPLWRTPPKLIFGNTIGYRRNIIPRIKSFFKKRNSKHIVSSENIQLLNELDKNGYLRLSKIDSKKMKLISAQFKKCISEDSKTFYMANNGNQTFVKDPLRNIPEIKDILNDLKPLFLDMSSGEYFIKQFAAKRNIHIGNAFDHVDSGISNAFHNDGLSCRDRVIYILLSDNVNKETGATKFINKKDSKSLSRDFEYFSRRFLTRRFVEKMYEKAEYFEGSLGDIYMMNTPEILHGATIPKVGSTRDTISFIYTEDQPKNSTDFLHFSD
tara:strand:+ start:147 stop:1028 length:882 start_codon:yes stop_codon:yes gene_type:complete